MYENLTEIQKIALQGEVARTLLSSTNQAELKLNIFFLLDEAKPEYRDVLLRTLRESTDLDKETLESIYFYVTKNITPINLWIATIVAEMKRMLSNSGDMLFKTESLPFDKNTEKKNLLKSMFMYFVKKLVLISPDAVEMLLDNLLQDTTFDFLKSTSIFIKEFCQEVKNSKFYTPEISKEILKYSISATGMLSYENEMNRISENLEQEKSIPEEDDLNPKKTIKIVQINQVMNPEEAKALIEHFALLEENDEKISYVVQKVYKNTNLKIDIRPCESEKEAEEYIDKINKEYPELNETCKFIISKKKLK